MTNWKMIAAVACFAGSSAASATVVSSLPTLGTTDWTTGAFDIAAVGSNAQGATVFETAPYRGVWFGYGENYGYWDASSHYHSNVPAWHPGSDAAGNHLSLTASFGPSNVYGPNADWSAYFLDQQYEAALIFNPTHCDWNCYGPAGQSGVEIYFGQAGSPWNAVSQFVALDTSQLHTYEFLLKGGLVSYRIDGSVYSGQALSVGYSSSLLVIGDGSGSTGTGQGSMTISAVSFDTAPSENILLPTPEPATWATMLIGFGLVGRTLRIRQRFPIRA